MRKPHFFPLVLGVFLLALIMVSPAHAQQPNQEWLYFPVNGAERCGANFGENNPIGKQSFHNAVDGACGMGGSPIQAVADGVLVWNEWWPAGTQPNGHGITAVVYHPQSGLYTYYAHMSETNADLNVGDKVKQGEVLGWVGHTGFMTVINDHIHFAVRTEAPDNTSCWNTSCWLNPDFYLGTAVVEAPKTTSIPDNDVDLATIGLPDIKVVISSSVVETKLPTPQSEESAVEIGDPNRIMIPIFKLAIVSVFLTGVLIVFGAKRSSAKYVGLAFVMVAITGFVITITTFSPPTVLASEQTPLSPPPQAEPIEISVRVSLDDDSTSPPKGDCAIKPGWPQSVQQWCPWITQYSTANGLEPDWVAAVMWQESGGKSDAVSSAGAIGLIQVMPSNGYIGTNDAAGHAAYVNRFGGIFANRPSVEELSNPEFNLAYGTGYLGGLLKKHGSMWEALYHYGGPDDGTYRKAVTSHYDCIVRNQSCTYGLNSAQGD